MPLVRLPNYGSTLKVPRRAVRAATASLAPLEQPTSSKRRDAGRREVWPMIMERVNMLQKVSFSSEVDKFEKWCQQEKE